MNAEYNEIPIPVAVLELSHLKTQPTVEHGQAESQNVSIGFKDVEKAPPKKKTPPPCDDNDTSWTKFRKKTSRKNSEFSLIESLLIAFFGFLLFPYATDHIVNSTLDLAGKSSPSAVVNASVVLFYGVLSTMFIFGWVSLNSCAVNPLIPVYLIVAGSTGILTKALIHTRNKYLFNVVILLVLFDLGWQAFGSYNVYSEYQPNYDPTNGQPFCHRVAYLLAFWIITIVYSLIGLFILLSSCYFLMRNTFRQT